MRKGKVIYAGKYLKTNNSIGYIYYELTEDNKLGNKWRFKKDLFRKGTIGSVYDCEFKNETISYNKGAIPTSYIQDEKENLISTFILFPMLYKAEEETRQIEIKIKNSKKPETLLDIEIKNLKEIYKSLSPQARGSFIGNIVYKITN